MGSIRDLKGIYKGFYKGYRAETLRAKAHHCTAHTQNQKPTAAFSLCDPCHSKHCRMRSSACIGEELARHVLQMLALSVDAPSSLNR